MNDWGDGICTVHIGDVREVLAALPDASVHCVVTSPPYWGLRDYGTAVWVGGDPACEHKGRNISHRAGVPAGPAHGSFGETRGTAPAKQRHAIYRLACGRCGAHRVDSQLGLEATPEEYVASMVAVFREVRRVLRSDGSLWLNMGDCYAAGANGQKVADKGNHLNGHPRKGLRPDGSDDRAFRDKPFSTAVGGLKPKDLVGMPWMLAFALRADGWWLRKDNVWSKPNPMPESVRDRTTTAHEYVFHFTKSARSFYDADAIREAAVGTTPGDVDGGAQRGLDGQPVNGGRHYRQPNGAVHSPYGQGFTRRSGEQALLASGNGHAKGKVWSGIGAKHAGVRDRNDAATMTTQLTRNKRSVWTIATQPYSEAHFAAFPELLVEPCVLAGTSAYGCCPQCGAGWARISAVTYDASGRTTNGPSGMANRDLPYGSAGYSVRLDKAVTTVGWQPDCWCGGETACATCAGEGRLLSSCETCEGSGQDEAGSPCRRCRGRGIRREVCPGCRGGLRRRRPGRVPMPVPEAPVPAVVLDPFVGSGTTLAVARRLNRNAIGIDLDPRNVRLIRDRCKAAGAQTAMLLG